MFLVMDAYGDVNIRNYVLIPLPGCCCFMYFTTCHIIVLVLVVHDFKTILCLLLF